MQNNHYLAFTDTIWFDMYTTSIYEYSVIRHVIDTLLIFLF
jgi:hypothetical protein